MNALSGWRLRCYLLEYLKCGDVKAAKELFEHMPNKNIGSWNAMINGLAKLDMIEVDRKLFDEKEKREDEISWTIHAYVERDSMHLHAVLGTALVDMYAKCGCLDMAWKIFEKMKLKEVVTWNAMIGGLAMHVRAEDAIELFSKMQRENLKPDAGRWDDVVKIKILLKERGIKTTPGSSMIELDGTVLGPGLVDMYAKCRNLDMAWKVFEKMKEKEVVTWNAMIGALDMHGRAKDAIELSSKMQREKLKPNGINFVVDLLGRAGLLAEAEELINSMPIESNAAVYEHSCIPVKYMEILNWVKEWGSYCLNWNKKVMDIMHHCQISIPRLEMGDGSHPQNKQTYLMLERNFERLHMQGYKNFPSFD
uniref:Pentatricopeptide repeat-containing protein n=1 Tax=Quercus lobata TaxID=97700 RepID=A0A7N2L5S8_QUELO